MPYLFYIVHVRQPSICLSKLPSLVGVSLRLLRCMGCYNMLTHNLIIYL
jgi:hypothetical protein